MMLFQVQLIDGVWNVIVNDKNIECSSKTDAEVLAQIPVQYALTLDDAPTAPDRQIIESIISIGDSYRLMNMAAYRHLKVWLAKELT